MARRKRSVIVTSGGPAIRTFTSKGGTAPGTIGSFKPAQLGHFDPSTGRVYQHPRLRNDPVAASSKVRVTNPAMTGPRARERTRSIGMGRIGQTGRTIGIIGGAGD